MTDREKLIALLSVKIHLREGADPAEAVADYLLDNDVRPVVRCKDCKFHDTTEKFDCRFSAVFVFDDHFWAFGERKDEVSE